jgi:hypothetical protein
VYVVRVDAKLAVARAEFARRFAEVDETTKQAVLAAITESYAPARYEQQLVDCPACETPSLVAGTLQEEYDEDWDYHEQVLINVHLLVRFTPTGPLCRACDLDLNGRDEMDAAGVGDSWYLKDVDERDFYGDYSVWEP